MENNEMEKLVDYCVLGHELQILDQDAVIRRVDTWCEDNGISVLSDTRKTILKAFIEKAFRVTTMETWRIVHLWDETKTGPLAELIDDVLMAEMTRRDRALGIIQ